MTKQSKAQRLADDILGLGIWPTEHQTQTILEAAAELRRLDALNAELVLALEAALSDDLPYIKKCRAAYDKAKEQT